ncbi:MAG: FAD-dependent monooxygenase [Leadbetterella sp.]
MKTQVIISGAGPTGLMLAAQLCRLGIEFIIFDKKDGITKLSKAMGVQARTLEIYDEMGIAQKAINQGQKASSIKMIIGGKVQGGFQLDDLGGKKSPFPYMLILEQSKNEALLQEYVLSFNKSILWEHELVDFEENKEEVKVTIKDQNAQEIVIEGQYFVGCDGASSPVRKKLGFTFEGGTFDQFFYVADTAIEWNLSYGSDIYACLAKNTFVAFFPMKGEKRVRIIGMLPQGKTDQDDVQFEEIETLIKQEVGIPLDIKDLGWYSTYKVHTRMTNSFMKGRCFIAGDAAHIHSPAGGQGMNTGMQDVYNLAWKLAMVINGYADKSLLETYNEERIQNAKNLLKSTDAIFEAEAGSGWFTSFARVHIFPMIAGFLFRQDFVKNAVFKMISQTGISYENASISQDEVTDDKVKAGDRMPYFDYLDNNNTLISSYSHNPNHQFKLFHFGTESNLIEITNQNNTFDQGLKKLLIVHIDLNKNRENLEAIFGEIERDFILIVRPDNYIGLQSYDISIQKITDYLFNKLKLIKSS